LYFTSMSKKYRIGEFAKREAPFTIHVVKEHNQ